MTSSSAVKSLSVYKLFIHIFFNHVKSNVPLNFNFLQFLVLLMKHVSCESDCIAKKFNIYKLQAMKTH